MPSGMSSFRTLALATVYFSSFTAGFALPQVERSVGQGAQLTILPIGASITLGVDSTDGNGYRQRLQTLLQNGGNSVNFVGTVHSGSMGDNTVQAVAGQTIIQVSNYADSTNVWRFNPNVILLNVGTNNCAKPNGNPAAAPSEFSALLQKLQSHFPKALIVASSLLHNLNPNVDACVVDLNSKLHSAVLAANTTGKFAWADMYNAVPASTISTEDKTHPHDKGYQIMAQTWYDTIVQAAPRIGRTANPKALAAQTAASSVQSSVPTPTSVASTTSSVRPVTTITAASSAISETSVAVPASETSTDSRTTLSQIASSRSSDAAASSTTSVSALAQSASPSPAKSMAAVSVQSSFLMAIFVTIACIVSFLF